MYISKSIDQQWVDSRILPVMIDLIPLDEITPVSYLWLKNPASLGEMNEEILFNGYPWTSLVHIIRINREIRKILDELSPKEEKPQDNASAVLI